MSTFNTSTTQRPFQSNQTTQTYPQHNTQAIQTDLGLNENLTLNSTDSSTSTDVFDETVSINNFNSNKCSHTKQIKQVTFTQEQQNTSELLDKTIPMSEISPILETYEQQLQTFHSSKTFETLGANCNQPLVQPTSYHNEAQPMSTQIKAAMAQAALINFFAESGTVTSILNTVQPSHTQTLNELSDEHDLNVSQQGRSLTVSTQSYTIPHISYSTQAATHTTT